MIADLGVSTACDTAGACPSDQWPYDYTIDGFLDIYQANITNLQQRLLNLTDTVVGELIDLVDDFEVWL